MQQIYRGIFMSKYLQGNFIEIILRHGCSLVNLLYILRIPFYKNTYGGLLLHLVFLFMVSLMTCFKRNYQHIEINMCRNSLREKCPNTEFFLVRIQSKCGKIRTRKNPVFGHFSRSDLFCHFLFPTNTQYEISAVLRLTGKEIVRLAEVNIFLKYSQQILKGNQPLYFNGLNSYLMG